MDKELIKKRFGRTLHKYNTLAVVQRTIADRLAGLIVHHGPDVVNDGLEIGAGTGFLTHHLLDNFSQGRWLINDISPESQKYMPSDCEHFRFEASDGEDIVMHNDSLDVVASSSVVQWFRDMDGFVGRVSRGLRSGGVMAISTFGPDNFMEITTTTGDSLTYSTIEELAMMAQRNGLEVILTQQWTEKMTFTAPIEVLHHIKATGVNALSPKKWTHRDLLEFERRYNELYNPPTLTFHPIIIIAKKP